MNETKAFVCPTCGAPIDYRSTEESTIRCPYCNSSVIVPEELRVKKPQESTPTVPVFPRTLPAQKAAVEQTARRSVAAVLLAASVGLVLITGLVAFLLTARKPSRIPSRVQGMVQGLAAGPGRAVLTFGGEGTGPGLFQDARHVAVDGQGNIYVGDYIGGRIQVFDSSGKFLQLWMVDRKRALRGFAVDRNGIAYIAQDGLKRYEARTGKYLSEIKYSEVGWGFDDVQVTADGGLVAFWYINRDDLVRFDAQGKVVFALRQAISGQTDESELSARVASDGIGNIFVLGEFSDAVFKYSPEGKYLNRFGGEGDQPGQFSAPEAIAVDGQGRVYVSDSKGIQIFDGEGRYLDFIKVDGFVFGMTFNDRNELFVATGKKVIKYEVSFSGK